MNKLIFAALIVCAMAGSVSASDNYFGPNSYWQGTQDQLMRDMQQRTFEREHPDLNPTYVPCR